jgi:hypothetical protein
MALKKVQCEISQLPNRRQRSRIARNEIVAQGAPGGVSAPSAWRPPCARRQPGGSPKLPPSAKWFSDFVLFRTAARILAVDIMQM